MPFGELHQSRQTEVYDISIISVFRINYIDSQNENEVLHVVIEDLLECLNVLWDSLPIDTVIASILDPRTKWYDKIPKHEIAEALKILQGVTFISFLFQFL